MHLRGLQSLRTHHSQASMVIVNTGAQFAARLTGSAVTFTATVFLARELGLAGYGDFAIITAYVPIFYLFADAGLNALYIRDSQASGTGIISSWEDLFSTRMVLSAVLSVIALIGIAPLFLFIHPSDPVMFICSVLIFIPTIFGQSVITTANAWFQKHLRYPMHTRAIILGAATTIILLFLLMFTTSLFRLPGTLAALTFGSAVSAVASFYFVSGMKKLVFDFRSVRAKAYRHIAYSLPLLLSLILNTLYIKADLFLLAGLTSQEAVGIYGYAYKFFEFILVIPTFIMNSTYPILARLAGEGEKGKEEYLKFISRLTVWMGISSVVCVAGAYAVSYFLPLLAPAFIASRLPFLILSSGLPVFFFSSLCMWLLIIGRHNRSLVIIYAAGLLVNIVTNLMVIPRYSYIGAAYVTVGTELLTLLLSLLVLTVNRNRD